MAGGEDEAEQLVADVVVGLRGEVGLLVRLELARDLLLLAFEGLRAPQAVDRLVLGGAHEPGARVVRHARLRPLLQGGDERILREVLGKADVADDAREAGDQPGGLDPPDRVDGRVRVLCHAGR